MKRYPIKIEVWKLCEVIVEPRSGYEGNRKLVEFPDYEVSNLGRVKRITKGPNTFPGKILKGKKLYEYPSVAFYSHSVKIHRLVAHAFIGPCPDGKEVNHKNGNKSYNYWRNLEYITKVENLEHAFKIGLRHQIGSKNPRSKFVEEDVMIIKRLLKRKNSPTLREIAKKFNAGVTTIRSIKINHTWKHVEV